MDPSREPADLTWNYPLDLRDALVRFGLRPTSATPPILVRDALNDLYRYELRRLRKQLVDGQVTRSAYVQLVIGLRKKYWPLTMLPQVWERICRSE